MRSVPGGSSCTMLGWKSTRRRPWSVIGLLLTNTSVTITCLRLLRTRPRAWSRRLKSRPSRRISSSMTTSSPSSLRAWKKTLLLPTPTPMGPGTGGAPRGPLLPRHPRRSVCRGAIRSLPSPEPEPQDRQDRGNGESRAGSIWSTWSRRLRQTGGSLRKTTDSHLFGRTTPPTT